MTRFMKFVQPDGDCLRWDGAHSSDGYARFRLRGRTWMAHRLVYEHFFGPIPKGMQIDHVAKRGCQFRDCVNYKHLEIVTSQENSQRGKTGWHMAIRTHCPHGHPYDEENTYWYPNGRWRGCRKCRRAADLKRKAGK